MIKKSVLFCLVTYFCTHSYQEFTVSDFTITCKSGTLVRSEGDKRITSPLHFQYTTQDNYSCQVQMEPSQELNDGARVVILTPDERFAHNPITKKAIIQNPSDLGISGNFQFKYATKGPQGQNWYGFVDYKTNTKLKNFLEKIKVQRHALSPEEQTSLGMKPPATHSAITSAGTSL